MAESGFDWYTVFEAGQQLSLSPNTVRKYCQQGKIRAKRFGIQWRVPAKEVERYGKLPRLVGNPEFRKQRKRKT